MDDVVAIQVDRSPHRVLQQQMVINEFPTLTTSTMRLFLLSARGVFDGAPDREREFFRMPLASERMSAQGCPPGLVLQIPPGKHLFASGNA
eukprot:4030740-Pyramimonas_sp.AAC.1